MLGPAGDYRLGAGQPWVREHPRGGDGEGPLRLLLPQTRIVLAGPADPVRDGQDCVLRARRRERQRPSAGASTARATRPRCLTATVAGPAGEFPQRTKGAIMKRIPFSSNTVITAESEHANL